MEYKIQEKFRMTYFGMKNWIKIKFMSYSSKESHAGEVDSRAALWMAAQQDNVIDITLYQAHYWFYNQIT